MTDITWRADLHCDHWSFALNALGHATGEPLACAGVSALVFALAGWLRNAGDAVTVLACRTEEGDAEFLFRGDETALAVFEAVVIGLRQIAAQYPDAVRVIRSYP